MRTTTLFLTSALLAIGCGTGRSGNGNGPTPVTTHATDGGVVVVSSDDGGTAQGPPVPPNCNQSNPPTDGDQDSDGYTPAQGDCNDCDPSINPGAVQVAGSTVDYACNGMAGVVATCDTNLTTKNDAPSLAAAMELCDSRFLVSAVMTGPSVTQARRIEAAFGVVDPRTGKAMSLISTGIAASTTDSGYDATLGQNPGNSLGSSDTYANPLPALPGVTGCSQTQPSKVNDYTELTLTLKAPTNATSFSVDFQFFSAEYPEFVCTEFNDEFLIIQKSTAFPTDTNVAFDSMNDAVTINSGFFTVCNNDPSNPHANHCTSPVSGINGTGFEASDSFFGGGAGGSTGWLTTTSPVTPGETFTLRFVIFDEGDHALNSDSLIDNFRWGTTMAITGPTTQPIQ